MITYKSLQKEQLILSEIRRTLHQLPSFKWKRYAISKYKNKINGDVAICLLLQDLEKYLDCVFRPNQRENQIDILVENLKFSLLDLVKTIKTCEKKGSAVPTSEIKKVTSSITKLYRATRVLPNPRECKDKWIKVGILYPVAI
ncbi:hypothetical protein [Teredinibacter turnerae]|uniref:hypothetical protein n=1 Tax=Teredinibacter turnerae TaxID=2426 RepID=UPI0030CB5100